MDNVYFMYTSYGKKIVKIKETLKWGIPGRITGTRAWPDWILLTLFFSFCHFWTKLHPNIISDFSYNFRLIKNKIPPNKREKLEGRFSNRPFFFFFSNWSSEPENIIFHSFGVGLMMILFFCSNSSINLFF